MTKTHFELAADQKGEVDRLYNEFIKNQQTRRQRLYDDFLKGPVWNNDLIKSHFEESTQEPEELKKLEKKLMYIINDILIFPELYLDTSSEELEKLYALIDAHKAFEILFISHGHRGPKTHGSIAIGCTSLQSGMAISGVGDPTRIKMELPKEFSAKLIKLLEHDDVTLNEDVQKQFGTKEKIIKAFETAQYFDSRAINMLLSGCSVTSNTRDIKQEDITVIGKEFNAIVFKFNWKNKQVYAVHQELWTKPRLSQQFTDTQYFNGFYPDHLVERNKHKGMSALFHPITRKIAFRQQPHVMASAPIRNFLYFERDKVLRDGKRSIDYKFKTSEIWTYGNVWGSKENTSECVGFATRLLGAMPIVGSIINRFSRNGLQIPLDSEVEKQQKAIRDFLKVASPTLCFGHLNQNANIRDAKHKKLKNSDAGMGIVFDAKITKFFSIGLGPVKEHVWGAVITDGNGILLPKDQWKHGWISKEKTNNSPIKAEVIPEMIGAAEPSDLNQAISNDPRLEKMGAHVTLREAYDAEKFIVPALPTRGSPELEESSFKEGSSFMLGSHMAKVENGNIHWNGHMFNVQDYKGHPILIPDTTMYGWLEQRRIVKMNVEGNPGFIKETVVFGTATDKYPLYPDLLGFMPRRNISLEATGWGLNDDKRGKYERRLLTLNPDRKKIFGQQLLFNPVGYAKQFLNNRWDDICEKCGLQIKHAPRKLMINRFISTHDDFIFAYLNGSKGIPAGTKLEGDKKAEVNIPRPAHVTDHELYRSFAGKHRKEILDHMHFSDENLVFDAPSKANETCYNPIQLLYHRKIGLRYEDDYVSPFSLD